MNRQENLYLIGGIVNGMDDSQLCELYQYAVWLTRGGPHPVSSKGMHALLDAVNLHPPLEGQKVPHKVKRTRRAKA